MVFKFKNSIINSGFHLIKLTISIIILLLPLVGLKAQITSYKVWFGKCQFKGKEIAVIRQYENAGKVKYVGIDVNDLSSHLLSPSDAVISPSSLYGLENDFPNSTYIKALLAARKNDSNLQDAGITTGDPNENGLVLSIDLCPSNKPLDREIFTSLINSLSAVERPIPVSLSITGKFLLNHKDDILWLKQLENSNQLQINWINHSFNHHYDPSKPLPHNFLLEQNTNIAYEVLQMEKTLVQNNILFSAFFRFPGLVSDQKITDQIIDYGLIPIGSDAWLAKGQNPMNGSIVLIHGNGNEPIGIRDFINLLTDEQSKINHKQWKIFDLRTSLQNKYAKLKN